MLSPSASPLVWIDCEMTGLSPTTDVLLQVACYITSPTLSFLDPQGFETVIHREPETLAEMSQWCINTHSRTGLTQRVLSSTITPAEAAQQLLCYIKRHVPEKGTALLAGNTVHADKEFLRREMPEVLGWLGHRILDVSAIKEAARRWCGEEVLAGVPAKKGVHEAREDILESIEEARYWKATLFNPVRRPPTGGVGGEM
jgi:oligoribonuclease